MAIIFIACLQFPAVFRRGDAAPELLVFNRVAALSGNPARDGACFFRRLRKATLIEEGQR